MLGLAFVCVGFVSVEGVVIERWSPRGSNTKVVAFYVLHDVNKKTQQRRFSLTQLSSLCHLHRNKELY